MIQIYQYVWSTDNTGADKLCVPRQRGRQLSHKGGRLKASEKKKFSNKCSGDIDVPGLDVKASPVVPG